MSKCAVNLIRKKIDTINFLLKISTPLKNRIPFYLTKKIDGLLKLLKEQYVFNVIKLLDLKTGVTIPLESKRHDIQAEHIIWTAWLQGREKLPPLISKCVDTFSKIPNKKTIIIDLYNYSDYIHIPAAIVEKFNSGKISYAAFSEIIRLELLVEYGGLWLDATIFIDRDISYLLKDKRYVCLRASSDITNGNLMGVFPVYFLYSNGHSEGLKIIRNLLRSYWLSFDVQIDYFLVDYIFKYVYLSNDSFENDTDIIPLLGVNRFLLNDIMSKGYNEVDSLKLKDNQVPVYKLSNKLKYKLLDEKGNVTFFSKIMNSECLY
ncbi:capsular polysaccharide synthesis protein [Klebsiella michiganensis]